MYGPGLQDIVRREHPRNKLTLVIAPSALFAKLHIVEVEVVEVVEDSPSRHSNLASNWASKIMVGPPVGDNPLCQMPGAPNL
jgi:hypothetical protein